MSNQEAIPARATEHGLGLRVKLIAAFLFLTMLIGACGGAGMFYVAKFDEAVSRFADVASPMLAASLRLSDNAQEMRAELQAALNSRDRAGAATQIARLAALGAVGEKGLAALAQLTDASGQDLKLEEAGRLREEFARRIKQAIEAHGAGSAAAALTSDRFSVFDAQIQELDDVLAGLAASIEAAMTKVEEEAKAKVQSGEATADWLAATILETLTTTYPAVQSVYRLMRESVKLQELTKSHLAQTKPDELETIEQEAQKTLRASITLARRLAARLRSGEARAEAAKITQAMTAMNLSLLADDGLFAANRQQFAARAQIVTEQAGFAQAQEAYLALLAQVEAAAERMNAAAKDGAEAGVRESLISVGAVMALGVVIALVFGLLFARSMVGPLTRLTQAMRRLADGALETNVPELDRADEIGQMAGAVAVFKENGLELRRAEADKREAEARAETQKREAALKLAADFDASVGAIVAAVAQTAAEMRRSAEALNETAGLASLQASAASASSDQVSSNVQTVASSSEELAASIGEIGAQVAMSSRIASAAVDEAADTDAKVQGLARAADQIGAVVNLISEIAAQTNLLALNATIEAARAGDAGRGFAVVATEVKSLATQTARATREISAKVAEIQAATGGSVTAIRSIGRTIGEMNEIATSIASAVEEQGAATHEIARNVQEAARATQEVSSNINGVTQASAVTGEACAHLLNASGGLATQAESLRQEVDQFLRRVRAA